MIGGNLQLTVPLPGRKGQGRDIAGMTKQEIFSSSRKLSRWPPLLMRAMAIGLQTCTLGEQIKMRAVSWQEHVAAGHTPFRKECRVCQEASAQDAKHRRQHLPPKAGILSVDITGPFRQAPALNKRHAKYLLVACFTWPARSNYVQEERDEDFNVPDSAPEIEDQGAENIPVLEDEPPEQEVHQQEERKEPEEGKDQKEEELREEERQDIKIEVTKMCEPISSRSKEEITKAIINMYMRLRADGYVVTQLHSDLGAEFKSKALESWCQSRTILHTYTPGDQPQMNGRCEVTVKHLKAAIRRTLHGAGAPFERWPLAARFINEKLRQKQVGKEQKTPPFLSEVLVRKRFWRMKELEPTQERVLYLCPSWVHHGHWVERPDGTQTLTKMVMHGPSEPPTLDNWIGVEDALNPIRREGGCVTRHQSTKWRRKKRRAIWAQRA